MFIRHRVVLRYTEAAASGDTVKERHKQRNRNCNLKHSIIFVLVGVTPILIYDLLHSAAQALSIIFEFDFWYRCIVGSFALSLQLLLTIFDFNVSLGNL